jgi:type VI secretion system protein ImpK
MDFNAAGNGRLPPPNYSAGGYRMNAQIERRAIPTLMGGQRRQQQPGYGHIQTLVDLLGDGFYLLFMLKNGSTPPEQTQFFNSITALLADFDRDAAKLRAASADIEAAKYAFCAALDEIILSSNFSLRTAWERRPLQLAIFGDQLAGEHFFDRLEVLRSGGAARLAALQVFQMCLLIGFKGRYALEPQRQAGLPDRPSGRGNRRHAGQEQRLCAAGTAP